MPDNLCNTHHSRGTRGKHLAVFLVMFLLLLTSVTTGSAADKVASNKQPLSFGKGQTIIDLQKVVWEPLKGEGIPPGVQIALLRGDLAAGGGELLVRLPANFTFPNHSHTSDELYVWIQGDFTYIAEDGTATPLSRVGSRAGAPAVGGGFPLSLFRLRGGFTIPPWPRFQPPPRQTVREVFPHTAFR